MRKLKNSELKRLPVAAFREEAKIPVVLVLDNIRSSYNVGSVFRTADAFLIDKIYLCGISATPPNKEVRKTALGATDSVAWEYMESAREAVEQLKEEGYRMVAVEQVTDSTALQDFTPLAGEKYALIFGHEVKGVGQELVDRCDTAIEIPQYGTKHSLNVSVSAGLLLWHFFQSLYLRG